MAYQLRPDFDELLSQRRQRPVPHYKRQYRPPFQSKCAFDNAILRDLQEFYRGTAISI
jgi:hypothetical protein